MNHCFHDVFFASFNGNKATRNFDASPSNRGAQLLGEGHGHGSVGSSMFGPVLLNSFYGLGLESCFGVMVDDRDIVHWIFLSKEREVSAPKCTSMIFTSQMT